MKRWPKVGERVLVHRSVRKRHLDDDERESVHGSPSELAVTEHETPIEGIAVARCRLSTEDQQQSRTVHELVGVRVTIRGRMHRARLEDVEPAPLRLAAVHGPAVERRIVNAAIEWHGGRRLSAISAERGAQTLALSAAVEDLLRPPTCGCCGTSPCTCPTLDGGA